VVWAIARVGETSDVTQVANQRLGSSSVSVEAAQQKDSDLAGAAAVDILRIANAAVDNGRGPTREQYTKATIVFLEKEGVIIKLKETWFASAANVTLADPRRWIQKGVLSGTDLHPHRCRSEVHHHNHW